MFERIACKIPRKANHEPCDLQEDLADSGVVVHYSTVQLHLNKYKLQGRVIWKKKPFLHLHHKIQHWKFEKELNKPDTFWKQVMLK